MLLNPERVVCPSGEKLFVCVSVYILRLVKVIGKSVVISKKSLLISVTLRSIKLICSSFKPQNKAISQKSVEIITNYKGHMLIKSN